MLVIVSKQYSDNKWLLAAVVFYYDSIFCHKQISYRSGICSAADALGDRKMVSERKKIPVILAAVFSLFVLLTVSDKAPATHVVLERRPDCMHLSGHFKRKNGMYIFMLPEEHLRLFWHA